MSTDHGYDEFLIEADQLMVSVHNNRLRVESITERLSGNGTRMIKIESHEVDAGNGKRLKIA